MMRCPTCRVPMRTTANGSLLQCPICDQTQPVANIERHAPDGPIAPTAGTIGARRNRKVCESCGADVTFADRVDTGSGGYRCAKCAEAAFEGALDALETPMTPEIGSDVHEDIAAVAEDRLQPRRTNNTKSLVWISLGAAVLVIGLVIFALVINSSSWTTTNQARLLSIKSEADQLLVANKPREAFYKYQELADAVKGHDIDENTIMPGALREAAAAQQRAYALAKPIIDREIAEEKARVAAAAKAEEERLAQARAAAEARRVEQERQAAAQAKADRDARQAAVERSRRALALAAVRKSAAYAELRDRADGIVRDFHSGQIGEDSAYRAMSRAAGAQRDLLAVFVTLEGMLNENDVSSSVNSAISASDRALIGEDSAIREVYKKDSASFELLGVWARVLDRRYPGLLQSYEERRRSVTSAMIGEDSAPRAIEHYTAGNMMMLGLISTRLYPGVGGDDIASKALRDNIGEDSTWRASMRESNASARILLLLLQQSNPEAANRLRKGLIADTADEDSALRDHARSQETAVEALYQLIHAT